MGDDKKKVKICRVCLSPNGKKGRSLFEVYKECLIFDYVNSITNVKIQKGDGLPDKICIECLLELETAIHFKQKCESSNIILQSTHLEKLPETTLDSAISDVIKKELLSVVIKKEEPFEESIDFLEDDSHFIDSEDLFIPPDSKPAKAECKDKCRAPEPQVECHDCGNLFKSKCKLRVHWKKVHMPEALICQVCKRAFKSYKPFNRHRKNGTLGCKVAPNIRIEGLGKNRVFHCKECNYNTRRVKDIQTHLVVHSGERPFPCDLCPKKFSQQSSLQAHKETRHKEYKVQITCQYCGKFVRGRTNVYRHLKTHTDGHHQCKICEKVMLSKKSLQSHMKRHTGVKQYTCEVCAKSFYTCAELCNHRRMIHMKGKYWYFCDKCEYKSIRSENIKKHKMRHTDTNFPCLVCGMFFEVADKLLQHHRMHFGEKKHPCPMCDKRFLRKDSVAKHIKTKHKCLLPTLATPKKVVVKKEITIPPNDELIEIELSPVIEIK